MHENNEIKIIRLDEIIPNRLQPRTEFDNEKLNELALSIKQHGIINPIIIRKKDNHYEIVAGERRYRASKLLGLETIPARIIEVDDKTSAELAIIENIQRENLSVIEEARSYRKLVDVCGITQEELAKKLGKSQGTIANKMRLLNLCDEVQEALIHNKISERHARALLQLKNIDDQRELLEKIINQKLSVKNTEYEIKNLIDNPHQNSEKIDMPVTNEIIGKINDNIYGNDIVSIEDLNKKEIEKEDIIMNEQNLNVNPTVVTNPTTEAINNEQNIGVQTPAFGGRFFPSLEDQPTNLNMDNAFPTAPQETPIQPMMENLVDTNVSSTMPSTPIEQPAPTAVTEETQQSIEVPVPEQPMIEMPTFVTNSENAPQVNLATESFVNPQPTIETPVPEPVATPIVENPVDIPVSTPQPAENTINNEVVSPLAETSTPSPSVMSESPVVPPIVEQPMVEMPQIEQPVEMNNEISMPEKSKTGDVLAAMNAIKNLALSIQSIGYKLTINEENETDKYKITIELQK